MKRIRLGVQMTYRQQLVLALLLVVLLAVSMLYCLGAASLALHQAWQAGTLPLANTVLPENGSIATPTPPAIDSTAVP